MSATSQISETVEVSVPNTLADEVADRIDDEATPAEVRDALLDEVEVSPRFVDPDTGEPVPELLAGDWRCGGDLDDTPRTE